MKSKALALYSGIVGLVGGLYLLIAPFLLLAAVVSTAATATVTQSPELTESTTVTQSPELTASTTVTQSPELTASTTVAGVAGVLLPTVLKIAILVLGIVAIVYYKGESRVGSAPSVLLIVGGAVGLIPALGWVGGILAIIGGSLFLGSLKKFKVEG